VLTPPPVPAPPPITTHQNKTRRTKQQKQVKNIKHNGNISFSDILEVARVMKPRSCAKDFTGTVKEMLGTAVSVGCTIDRMSPTEVIEKINEGEIEVPDK